MKHLAHNPSPYTTLAADGSGRVIYYLCVRLDLQCLEIGRDEEAFEREGRGKENVIFQRE